MHIIQQKYRCHLILIFFFFFGILQMIGLWFYSWLKIVQELTQYLKF